MLDYANLLRNQFISKYGDVGYGFVHNNYPYGASTTQWVYSGTWVNFGVSGWFYGQQGIRACYTNGSTASLTFNGTGVVVLAEGNPDNKNIYSNR
jgi:hypothetical protein